MKNYKGEVYVFDFDDTLYWAPDWYHDVVVGEDYIVTDPGSSKKIKDVLSWIKEQRYNQTLPSSLRAMKLKADKKAQPDGRNIFFYLLDYSNKPIEIEDLLNFFSEDELERVGVGIVKRYSPFVIVKGHNAFYDDLDTLGEIGENKDIVDIYRNVNDNLIILTARRDVPGMKEKVYEKSKALGKAPSEVYVRPSNKESGEYKGEVLLKLLKQDNVTAVHFYEDNLRYINSVENVINEWNRDNNTNLSDKLEIHLVSNKNKPLQPLVKAVAYLKILSKNTYLKKTGFILKYIREIYENKT